ncbi:hypothetical protein [Demequina pelophila]|uniref:hypothetical protein n=1 Tax=Demequina pelophila TaxID=1638984 RepID=UPI0007822FA9|nr:hypothetical protein [Demequina pelophila]
MSEARRTQEWLARALGRSRRAGLEAFDGPRASSLADRARVRIQRRRWILRQVGLLGAFVVLGLGLATAAAWPRPETETPTASASVDATAATSEAGLAVLAAMSAPRSPGEKPQADRQAALLCEPVDGADAAPATTSTTPAGAASPTACDAVWLDEALIRASTSTLTVADDGSARVDWRIDNVSERHLTMVVGSARVSVLTDPDSLPGPGDASAAATPGSAETAYGTEADAAPTLWRTATTREALVAAPEPRFTLSPDGAISGTATFPAGTVAPDSSPSVTLQVQAVAGDDVLILEADGGGPLTSAAVVAEMFDRARTRTFADDVDDADAPAGTGDGTAALLCDGPPAADDDSIADRQGEGRLWAPACTPLTLPGASVEPVILRTDIDQSQGSRVIRWAVHNTGHEPLSVDLAASTVVLELDPPVAPRADLEWESVAPGVARIATLWRTEDTRTAAVRLPEHRVVVVEPGAFLAGEATFPFPEDGGDPDAGDPWGARLLSSRATVQLVIPAAGLGDRVLVLEFSEPATR